MAAHRYWRIYSIINRGSATYTQFAEIELRATSGGADQTTTGGGPVSFSHALQAGSAAGTVANDGTTTFAQIADTTNVWWRYDFGAGNEKDITEVAIWGAVGAANRAPGQFAVQYSDDGTSWTDAWLCSASSYTENVAQVFTKPTAASAYRYWRVRMWDAMISAGVVFSIAEMEMATALSGADECSGGTAISYDGTSANAFDGSTATFWSSSSDASHHYLGYNFGAGNEKQIVEIRMLPRQDNSWWRQWPINCWVEAGSDGKNFLPIWSTSQTLNPYDGGYYTMRDPAAVTVDSTHRWWGIKTDTTDHGSVVGIREIEMRSVAGGADMCTGGVAGAWDPYDDGTFPREAFDNSTSEYGSGGLPELNAYDFGAETVPPAQLAITARASTNNNQAPKDFHLVYSDDGLEWTVYQTFSSPAAWGSAEQRLFNVNALPPDSVAERDRSTGQVLLGM